MQTWEQFRLQVRRSILKDTEPDEETGLYRWDNPELLDFCWWALAEFAQHTAVATATAYPEAIGVEYDLPDNILSGEPIDQTILVFFEQSTGAVTHYQPVDYTEDLETRRIDRGYYSVGQKLYLTTAPGAGNTLKVRYFAHYDKPYVDSDLVKVPEWAIAPLGYLIGFHALAGFALKASSIRQWNTKKDSGNPVQNPLADQQKYFRRLYDEALLRYPPQNRTFFLRS